jgi:AcrR family transcriptional regulator
VSRSDQATPETDGLPRFERPNQEHALRLARALIERGERIDMQELANALGIGRTTLYRWVGDREHLVETVFARLTTELFDVCAKHAQGKGLDRAIDTIRRFMVMTAGFEPLREFAQREPTLALRILISRDGAVQASIRAGVTKALETNLPDRAGEFAPETIDVLVQLGAALEWTPIVIGDEPEIERALQVGRAVLEANLALR